MSPKPKNRSQKHKIKKKSMALRMMNLRMKRGAIAEQPIENSEPLRSLLEGTADTSLCKLTKNSTLLEYSTSTSFSENHNCDLPSTSTPGVQFMAVADSEISEYNTTPIEEISNFSGLNDLDISDITSHQLETTIASINSESNIVLGGRRIVDIAYIFLQFQNSCSKMHAPGFGCTFIDVEFVKEIRKGFESTWIFKCKMCNLLTTILSEAKTLEYIPINKAIANGTCAIGIGYTQLAELSASIDVPCMSPNTYTKLADILSEDIKDTAWNVMKLAGIEEKQLAMEAGDVDIDGIPMCPVVADGQWSKRCYKTKYDAFSGAATIIGYRTKKVLFVGIRNRYCAICERAKIVKVDHKPHKCFLNWTKGATSMEADGIAEGFLRSIELHGLKFNKLIGDGDSSVTKRLNEVMPYGPKFLVEKIECRNHILRNYSQKLMNITKITKYPCFIRKFIMGNIIRFRTAITKSITYRKNVDESNYQKIEGLRKDILNSPYHIFGEHSNCAQYFCTGRKLNERNLVNEVLQCGLMNDISTALRRVADNSKSLLLDVDNNICEQFNSVINKHIGGKRINFSQKQSYSTRVYTAVVSFNTDGNYIRAIHKKITSKSPGIIAKKFLNHTADKRRTLRRRRALFKLSGVYKSKKKSCGPDEHYGLAEPLDDFLSEEDMKNKKAEFIKSLTLSLTAKKTLEYETRNQSDSQTWFTERRNRLTASNFGKICKMRPNTSCKNTVFEILYNTNNTKTNAIDYGKESEDLAIKTLEKIIKKPIQKCGLFVDDNIPYLAATPDGLIEDNAIVEVKCPFSVKDYESLEQALLEKKIPYLINKNNTVELKEHSNYYYQIQGQMHITKRNVCYFFIFTPKWNKLEVINYSEVFWKEKMESNLKLFYEECLLPEIVDSQYRKRMQKSDIIDPPHIKENIIKNKKIKL